jgi:hypothetical protein
VEARYVLRVPKILGVAPLRWFSQVLDEIADAIRALRRCVLRIEERGLTDKPPAGKDPDQRERPKRP